VLAWGIRRNVPSINVVAVRDECRVQAMLQKQQGQRKALIPPSLPSYGLRKAQALFDFSAEGNDEISFNQRDVLGVLKESDSNGWLRARNKGKEGFVPESFVKNIWI
jgi:hypothetical protein